MTENFWRGCRMKWAFQIWLTSSSSCILQIGISLSRWIWHLQTVPISYAVYHKGQCWDQFFFLSLCTVQLGQIIDKVGQQFAVDSGLYDSFQHNQVATDVAVQNSESCCRKLKAWMSANMLKLNDDRTDAVLCGSKTQQSKVSVNICVGESEISLCSIVRDLGLLIDSNITLHHHVHAVVRTCYFHLLYPEKTTTIPD